MECHFFFLKSTRFLAAPHGLPSCTVSLRYTYVSFAYIHDVFYTHVQVSFTHMQVVFGYMQVSFRYICASVDAVRGCVSCYGVATVSKIDKITGLFCRISSLLQGSFAKETYNFIDPTNQSHPSCSWLRIMLRINRSLLHIYITILLHMHRSFTQMQLAFRNTYVSFRYICVSLDAFIQAAHHVTYVQVSFRQIWVSFRQIQVSFTYMQVHLTNMCVSFT